MRRTNFDPISVLETAYAVQLPLKDWLASLAEAAADYFPDRSRMMSMVVETDSAPRIVELYSEGAEDRERRHVNRILGELDAFGSEYRHLYMGFGTSLTSLSALFGQDPAKHRAFSRLGPGDVGDYVGIIAHVQSGYAIQLGAIMPTASEVDDDWKPVWDQINAHIAAAFRLRTRNVHLDLDTADAVVEPSGDIQHIRSDQRSEEALRDALSEAVRRVDRARTDIRADEPHRALDLWRGLVEGVYTVVDYVDTDGRRFYIARRNDPDVRRPEGLSLRERQVVALVSLGYPNQLAAYALGLSPSTIASYLRRAKKKLGVDSRMELIRLFRGLTETD